MSAALSEWGYFAAFTPVGWWILAVTVVSAFAFLCGFIWVTYRQRQRWQDNPQMWLEHNDPDPPIPGAVLDDDTASGLPPTHKEF